MRKLAYGILFFVFFGFSSFGFLYSLESHHGHTGLVPCPLMQGSTALCTMTPIEHLSLWQKISTILATKMFDLSIIVLLFNAIGIILLRLSRLSYLIKKRNSIFANFYRELFSSGILNPKSP